MDKYSEAEIAKIINDCEILILPENIPIEEGLTIGNLGEKPPDEESREETEDDFERFYLNSKEKRNETVASIECTDFTKQLPEGTPQQDHVLNINRILQEKLLNFRLKLLKIIEKIDAKFTRNNVFLEKAKYSGGKDSTSKETSYIKCGAPFFKNALGIPAPFNDDYKFRKNILKEFFPLDLPATGPRWTTQEKIALITGVKDQMINHIKSNQCLKLCDETRKTRGRLQKLKFISQSVDLQQSAILDIYESIQRDYKNFAINWNLISFNNLQSNHSVSECMGMYFSYLRPDINRDPFTNEENEKIANLLSSNDYKSWNDIASHLDRRTSLQTFIHFHGAFDRLYPSHVRWTEAEDAKLLKAIEKYSVSSVINWNKVGQILSTRNRTQCYNRFQILSQSIDSKKGTFTSKENRKILDYVEKHGENAFKKLPGDFLPGRNTIQIKHHYKNALQHKGTVHPWTYEEDKKLMEFVEKEGTGNWRGIAEILKTHSRLSCRTRYLTITKFLAKNPEKTLEHVPNKLKKITGVQKAAQVKPNNDEEENLEQNKSEYMGNGAVRKFKEQNPLLFNLLRTTYNYDFAAREISADNTKLLVLMNLFKLREKSVISRRIGQLPHLFTTNQRLKLGEALNATINDTLLNEIKFATTHTQFLMPPNYNTCVGLRAIMIKIEEESFDEESAPEITHPTAAYSKELENFQKLFSSLFYWSAILKEVDKNELNETHFMKHHKRGMSANEVFQHLKKRRLPITAAGFVVKRSRTN